MAFGVMPRRAHLAESVRRLPAHHRIDRIETGADGAPHRLPRSGGSDRIAVEVAVTARDMLGDGADLGDVRLAVRHRDIRPVVVSERRLAPHEASENLVAESLVDRPHAVRPLGMVLAGVVVEEGRMREEERCHVGMRIYWPPRLVRTRLFPIPQASSDRRAILTPGGGLLSAGTKKSGASGIDGSRR